MFVRECLPGAPWAWTVGGLGAALVGILGFTSGIVTPDAMLCTVCAALFYCLARAFRRGMTRKLGVALGALTAIGLVTKVNFIGLAPGLMLALVLLAFRGPPRGSRGDPTRRAFGAVAIAAAVAAVPVCAYVLYNLLEHHPTLGLVSRGAHLSGGHGSLASDISYVWQLYLPRLPGMVDYFPGLPTTRDVWFSRTVGFYGWLDTSFPEWVYDFALVPTGLIAILALRALLARRASWRARLPEALVYFVMAVGLMALVGQDSHVHSATEGLGYAQPRYLLPLLPLGAAVLALAARGAGRRWGPAVGALIVVLFFAQDVSASCWSSRASTGRARAARDARGPHAWGPHPSRAPGKCSEMLPAGSPAYSHVTSTMDVNVTVSVSFSEEAIPNALRSGLTCTPLTVMALMLWLPAAPTNTILLVVDLLLIGVTSPATEPSTGPPSVLHVPSSISTKTVPLSGEKSRPTPDGACAVATSPSSPFTVFVMISPAAPFGDLLLTAHFFEPSVASQPV